MSLTGREVKRLINFVERSAENLIGCDQEVTNGSRSRNHADWWKSGWFQKRSVVIGGKVT